MGRLLLLNGEVLANTNAAGLEGAALPGAVREGFHLKDPEHEERMRAAARRAEEAGAPLGLSEAEMTQAFVRCTSPSLVGPAASVPAPVPPPG